MERWKYKNPKQYEKNEPSMDCESHENCKKKAETFEDWSSRVLKSGDELLVEDLNLAPYPIFQLRRKRLDDKGRQVSWSFMPKRTPDKESVDQEKQAAEEMKATIELNDQLEKVGISVRPTDESSLEQAAKKWAEENYAKGTPEAIGRLGFQAGAKWATNKASGVREGEPHDV